MDPRYTEFEIRLPLNRTYFLGLAPAAVVRRAQLMFHSFLGLERKDGMLRGHTV